MAGHPPRGPARGGGREAGARGEGTRRDREAFLAARAALEKQRAPDQPFPESFEHPGAYQWEALTDDQAASLIGPVTGLVDAAAWELVEDGEAEPRNAFSSSGHVVNRT
ncbi:MAG: hypothetical protein IIC73_08630 [Armatimonadetes bacterium]|nr:hypothetical protein [Armatimonadota bacterium]